MSKTVDLGPVSAYALAVKHGYEGTEEQWIAEVESKRVDAVNAAADAKQSADTAAEKAEIATQKAEEIKGESEAAAASATKAQSYAVGGTGSRDGEDTDNAQYYYEQVKRVSQGLNGIIPMGTVAFADLPVSGMENGWMYNISDDFTSDDRFNDGGGIFYGKGNNVIWTSEGKWDVTAGSGVTGIKGNKEKTYRQGNVNLTPEQIGAVAEDGDASDTTVAFASSDTPDVDASAWESVAKLTSGEKHASIFAKVSQMFKNVRYLYKMLGSTDISSIGGGTVTGAISSHNEAIAKLNRYSRFTVRKSSTDDSVTIRQTDCFTYGRLITICFSAIATVDMPIGNVWAYLPAEFAPATPKHGGIVSISNTIHGKTRNVVIDATNNTSGANVAIRQSATENVFANTIIDFYITYYQD